MGVNQRGQIKMTEAEVTAFLERSRTATMATVSSDGLPHLVAMWYALVDGKIYFETKAKSQKAVNLRRDPRIVVMMEAGDTYDQLRGVSIEGTAHVVDDTSDEHWAAAVSLYERYQGPYTDEAKPFLDLMMHKRIVVRVDPTRVRSWDHRKLDQPAMPLGGSTAEFLHDA